MNQTPLFGCADCYEDRSLPARDLIVYGGSLYCQDCWEELRWCAEEDSGIKNIEFCDLEPFIPAYERRIEELERELNALRSLK